MRAIEKFAGGAVADLVKFVMLAAGVVYFMVASNPVLAGIALLPMIPLILMTSSFGTKIGRLFFAVDQAVGEVSNRLQENVVGVQVVRAFAREAYEIKRFTEANRNVFMTWVHVIDEWSKIMRVQGDPLQGDDVLVVGDTPLDITCARAIGARVLAVATGSYSAPQLQPHQPTWLAERLEQIQPADVCS